jgi:hypothetical protein
MKEQEEKDQRKPQKQVEIGELFEFKGKDLLEDYNHFRYLFSKDPVIRYEIKRKCIEIGKELLPTNGTDPGKQKKITALYNKACEILKSEIPNKRNIEYDYFSDGSKRYTVYKMKANDAEECSAEIEKLNEILQNFTCQQHEQHMEKLQDIDNELFHVLVEEDIVHKIKPTINDIVDKRIEKMYKKIEETKI